MMLQWIETFARHRIAANAAMFAIIAAGLWGISQVNNQFFPDFEFDLISVNTTWAGTSAEDMYTAVGIPLQQSLTGMPEIDSVTTFASDGSLRLFISISDRAESMKDAGSLIEDAINTVDLPVDVDDPAISIPQRRENVADLLLYGDVPVDELADIAYQMQSELLQAGIAQVTLQGLPEQQIEVTIAMETLLDIGMTLDQVAAVIDANTTPQPAGVSDTGAMTLQLRSDTSTIALDNLLDTPILSWADGSELLLGDIAQVKRISNTQSSQLLYLNTPAIRLSLRRTPGEDTLDNAETMQQWLSTFKPTLPSSVQIHRYNETWQIVAAQLSLLLKNGALGMALVLGSLFFFLNTRLAFWVALGIPTSFFATFLVMSQLGISMNTISLFGFMIALGIIVDDAIVVGEQARAYQQQGMVATDAALKAAKKMWPPVLASSLTTIAAFMPLTLIGGPIGRLAIDIPLVVTIAIVASLIECFLILPGHLSHSHHKKDRPIRQKLDAIFNAFRDRHFRRLVRWSLRNRPLLVAIVLANLIIATGMIAGRIVPYQFQPSVESPSLSVTVEFAEGTEQSKVNQFINHLTTTLQQVEDETGYDFIKTAVITRNQDGRPNQARIDVELVSDQNRPYTNQELVNRWRKTTKLPSELDNISFGRGRHWGGESGDIEIQITGEDLDELKRAAENLKDQLNLVTGLSDATDSLPYGDEQLRFTLTPLARDLGITEANVASFLRRAIEGVKATEQVSGLQTLDVVVLLPEDQRRTMASILGLPYVVNGELVPLEDLINSKYQRGLEGIRAEDGNVTITVSATLNSNLMTTDEMYNKLKSEVIPAFQLEYSTLTVELSGDAQDQQEFFNDTKFILLGVVILIYGILAWVFESWVWPIAVLITVPFGLAGAIYGHWLVGLPLSSLSILGLFGLSGIVINDSIVLISVYRDLRDEGFEIYKALEEAVARRLRPVILTTITTMAGLTPLLFETSLDAQFLKPIAAGLVFGLLLGTTLILLFIPAMLLTLEQLIEKTYSLLKRVKS